MSDPDRAGSNGSPLLRPRSGLAGWSGLQGRPSRPGWSLRPAPEISADERQLVADVYGTGPPVVLLHGQPGAAVDWQQVTPLLSDRFRVIVPDRLGYGRTGGDAADFRQNAWAVARLLDRLGLERAVVTGYSWGGGVALAFAELFPARTAGLVLAASVGPGERFKWEDRVLAAPLLGETLAALALGSVEKVLRSRRVQILVDRHLRGRPRKAVDLLTDLTTAGSSTAVWRSLVVEQRFLLRDVERLSSALGTVVAPTAVINGSADRTVPPPVAERLAAAIPVATHTVLAGAHHLLLREQPDAVAAAVLQVAEQAWPEPAT
jgi:pimeloyl-ACP methyl ester carboxylesterase